MKVGGSESNVRSIGVTERCGGTSVASSASLTGITPKHERRGAEPVFDPGQTIQHPLNRDNTLNRRHLVRRSRTRGAASGWGWRS